MIVTIDGPCASGKSTAARALAGRMGLHYLDTGAMYRAVTWKAMQSGVELQGDPDSIIRIARSIRIDFIDSHEGVRVICDGRDVTADIRSPEVTRMIKYVADQPAAREEMVRLQRRQAALHSGIVTEGRDQGSVVFPDADVKFYLDADEETRAKRRMLEFRAKGFETDFSEVLEDIRQRDIVDRQRRVGGLRRTDSMVVIDTTDMSVEQVVSKMADIAEVKLREFSQEAARKK